MLTRRTSLALLASTALTPSLAFAQSVEVEEMTLGDPDAPVKVMEYGSFTCPHCARFHEEVYPDLKANYIDTGKVQFIYREVYFDRYGLWAGMMARCGGSEKYFGIADMLYAKQSEWARAGEPSAVVDAMRKIGLSAGIDGAALDACFQDQAKAEALVAEFQKNAAEDNVESTPTLFVNGTKYSNMSYTSLAAIIDEELGA